MTKLCTVTQNNNLWDNCFIFVVVEKTWKYFCHNVYHETAIACFLWQQKHSRDSSRLVINYPDQSSSQSFQTGAGDRLEQAPAPSDQTNIAIGWLTMAKDTYKRISELLHGLCLMLPVCKDSCLVKTFRFFLSLSGAQWDTISVFLVRPSLSQVSLNLFHRTERA